MRSTLSPICSLPGTRPLCSMSFRKPDWVARGLSLTAIIVSAGAALTSYNVGVAARVEASRPRMTVDFEIAKLDRKMALGQLDVVVSETNTGVSPARNVAVSAKAVFTNSLHYAFDQFKNSVECASLAFNTTGSQYPSKQLSQVISLDILHAATVMKVGPPYTPRNTTFLSGKPSIFIVGCISYSMDGVDRPFVEPVFKALDVRCGAEQRPCALPLQYNSEQPIVYNLYEPG